MDSRNNASKDESSKNLKERLEYYYTLKTSIKPTYESLRLIIIYVLVGSLWILFSDRVLMFITGDIDLYGKMQTYKGWFYVFFSGLIFYFIVKNRMELFKNSTDELYKGYTKLDVSHKELHEAKEQLQKRFDQLEYYKNALEESQLKYDLSIQGANDGVWSWDIRNDHYNTSIMTKKNFGYTVEEQNLVDTMEKWQSYVHPEDLPEGKHRLEEYISQGKNIYENIFRIRTSSGDYRWILSRGKIIRGENGEPLRLAGSHTDLTEQMLLKENLHQEKELIESISKEAPIGILVCNRMGIVTKINSFGEILLGYKEDEIVGKDAYQIFIDEQEKSELDIHLEKVFQGKAMRNIETKMATKTGEIKTILWSNSFLNDMNGEIDGLVFVGVDISDRKEMEEKLERLAYFDPLTEMSNREKFKEDTVNMILNNQDSSETFALVYVDIDNFKLVNDTMGHAAGDELLRHVGYSMVEIVGSEDRVYRFGGDEFVMLVENISDDSLNSKVNALMEKVRIPWYYKEQPFHISASAGIAVYPIHGRSYEQLMQNADTALSYAKEEGKNIFIVYDREMRERAWNHIQLTNDLRFALERNEFELYYQPQFSLSTGNFVGVEALIRWNHPVRGNVPPIDFIPFSEETGQIDKIEEWVIDTACRQGKEWDRKGYENVTISINISGKMLGRSEWIDRIHKYITDCQSYGRIIFEITETAIISDMEVSLRSLRQIHDLGIKLALDDFGTGFSSLTYLQKLPIDIIKLDKDFIWEIGSDQGKEFIIKSVIDLAHNLGMSVVAEGVETDGQLSFLKDSGCDYAQGYLFNKPLSVENVEEVLKKL
ncbi:bifunctional diguanylate cyclase/phosphodiesterase [Gudongella sp. SC589]|uniref:bifunctional diguanylate cyclase/phosphodiesterase n=1 Tax=Gudongella sp. SC589 TaxID=3385990 RepID=UPI0039048A0D